MKLLHIVNPVKIGPQSDLFKAQPITFESMRRAAEYNKEVQVELLSTQYPEDEEIIPEYFTNTGNMNRSVLDVGSFELQRKLPILRDILQKAHASGHSGDYIVYTNSDIGLMPYFYEFVANKINSGLDAFVINRRTISADHSIEDFVSIYADPGVKHPGFDCFIFPWDAFEKYELGEVCIGVSKIGITLLINLIAHANRFELFTDEHLTFHLGEDRAWQNPKLNDYFQHNVLHAWDVYQKLCSEKPELLEYPLMRKHYDLLQTAMSGESEPPTPNSGIKSKIKQIFKK